MGSVGGREDQRGRRRLLWFRSHALLQTMAADRLMIFAAEDVDPLGASYERVFRIAGA
jgi:hypothetical protein